MSDIWPAIVALVTLAGLIITIGGLFGRAIKTKMDDEAKARAESATNILAGQTSMKTDLKVITDKHENRLDRLDEKLADTRTAKSIDEAILHARNNLDQKISAVVGVNDKTMTMVDSLKDRVTRLETQHEQTTKIVGEIKSELRETRSKINHRFDTMAEQQKSQFDQLCASIREVREIKPRQ